MCARAAARAGLPLRGAVLKTRLKGSGNAPERAKDDVVGEPPPEKLIVHESEVPYEVHLRGGINVGLFTDMREHRAGLARFVRGKRVLNTFAYTGALSVAADAPARPPSPASTWRRGHSPGRAPTSRSPGSTRPPTAGKFRTCSDFWRASASGDHARRRSFSTRPPFRASGPRSGRRSAIIPSSSPPLAPSSRSGRPPLDLVQHPQGSKRAETHRGRDGVGAA